MQEDNTYQIIPLSERQLDEQLETILYFLGAVHPTLKNPEGYRPCVEIRPILRGEYDFALSRSLLIWDLSDKTKVRLREFLTRHNGQPSCLFYSVFTFDNNKKVMTKKQTEASPGKITTSSALSTSEIALDFDDIDFSGYVELVDRFEEMGIYAIWVATGHGFQAHVLLKESIADKSLLQRFVYKFRSKGFNCDPACVDPARVMRLPGTYNNKCFSDDAYADERMDPPACELVQESAHRYDADFVLEKLDKLPTVSREDEEFYLSLFAAPRKTKAKAEKPVQAAEPPADEDPEDLVEVRRIEYPYLANYEVPPAVAKMLAHTPRGYRNNVLGFLIRFFKTYYRLGKTPALEILTIWAKEACDPVYPEHEFTSDFKRFYYHYNGRGYDTKLAQKFGHIDFETLVELRKRDIVIPHKFFQDFAELDGKAVRLYLAIKMQEHIEADTTQESLAELLGISDRALRPTMQALIKAGHAYQKKGNSRLGVPNTYHTHRGYSPDEGYITFSYNDIRAYVTELYENGSRGNGELKLYLFMRWKFFAGEIYMSQTNLGRHTGVTRNAISIMAYKLQEKHFLKIRKVRRHRYFESCEYTLLR